MLPLNLSKRLSIRLLKLPNQKFLIASFTALISLLIFTTPAHAADFPKLDEAISGPFVADLAPVFDFDTDSCLPSAGFSRAGQKNPGLRTTGSITGQCRSSNFLDISNTLHRDTCVDENGSRYCGHFYALYFKKDQVLAGLDSLGHRHDWENVAIWTKDGVITHASASAHGDMSTRPLDQLPLDANGHVKIVYHKDGASTHAMRFAKTEEVAENPYGRFVTPTIASWCRLRGDGITNLGMRNRIEAFDYGRATIPLKRSNFLRNINRFKPPGYPTFQTPGECR